MDGRGGRAGPRAVERVDTQIRHHRGVQLEGRDMGRGHSPQACPLLRQAYIWWSTSAGTTDIAVISLAGIVFSKSVRMAGNQMDEAVVTYLKRKYNSAPPSASSAPPSGSSSAPATKSAP